MSFIKLYIGMLVGLLFIMPFVIAIYPSDILMKIFLVFVGLLWFVIVSMIDSAIN